LRDWCVYFYHVAFFPYDIAIFLGHITRGRPKKLWDEVVKEDMKKKGLCINDAQDRRFLGLGTHLFVKVP